MENVNLYNYSHSNPINLTDPSGRTPLVGVCVISAPFCAAAVAEAAKWTGIVIVTVVGTVVTIEVASTAADYFAGEFPEIEWEVRPNETPQPVQKPKPVRAPTPNRGPTDPPPYIDDLPTRLPTEEPTRQPITPTPTPITPTPTCTPEPEKHISLGTQIHTMADGTRVAHLFSFTQQLNKKLNPSAYVYMFSDWQSAGLAISRFPTSFDEAAHTPSTKTIHFSLFDIKGDPNDFAKNYGGNGVFRSPNSVITAVELYKIKNEGLCRKTKFYRRVTPALGNSMYEIMTKGTFVESVQDWVNICLNPEAGF